MSDHEIRAVAMIYMLDTAIGTLQKISEIEQDNESALLALIALSKINIKLDEVNNLLGGGNG